MDENNILAQFCLLTGLTQEQAQDHSGLLSSARRQVEKQLNPQAETEYVQETLEQLANLQQGEAPKRISTPDLTVEWQENGSQQAAGQLIASLRQSLADVLETGFAFRLA